MWQYLCAIILLYVLGCGIKGDPLPPEAPPEIGQGYPTFDSSQDRFKDSDIPPVEEYQNRKKNKDKENE
ncbi:MAG: hypothetical protein D6797_04355 [Bdellovibrio sp.]|nr:MAG: hypothetical protein D6797_04355 [Bdellovibrio sp.]